jgi:hypothetical protein
MVSPFRRDKISLQDASTSPGLASRTVPGSGNFCLLTETPTDRVVAHLEREGIDIIDDLTSGPVRSAQSARSISGIRTATS